MLVEPPDGPEAGALAVEYYIVTMTYRVQAISPEEALEVARDLAFEDVDPASVTAFPEVKV